MAESVNTGKVQISEFRFLQTDVKLKVFVLNFVRLRKYLIQRTLT